MKRAGEARGELCHQLRRGCSGGRGKAATYTAPAGRLEATHLPEGRERPTQTKGSRSERDPKTSRSGGGPEELSSGWEGTHLTTSSF